MHGYFWPKVFWDFLTKTLDPAVKPIPILQTVNLVFGLGMIALEWPLSFLAGSALHRSLEFRLAVLPLTALASALMYQGTDPALFYLIGMGVYFFAYSEGEVCSDLVDTMRSWWLTWKTRSSAHGHGRCLNVGGPVVPREYRVSLDCFPLPTYSSACGTRLYLLYHGQRSISGLRGTTTTAHPPRQPSRPSLVPFSYMFKSFGIAY